MFACASDFCDKVSKPTATLNGVDNERAGVGERIRFSAQGKGIKGPAALCALLHDELTKRGVKQTFTRQTVSNWWHGKVYPDLDTLDALAKVLGTEREFLLFGSRRNDQLRKEKLYLQRISDEESLLLTAYRESSKSGQRSMLKVAKGIAEEHPADEATIHQMRRKDD